MATKELELDCGSVEVKGMRRGDAKKMYFERESINAVCKDNEVERKRQLSDVSDKYLQKCIITPANLDLDEITPGEYSRIQDAVLELSGLGGDVEKKSGMSSGDSTVKTMP